MGSRFFSTILIQQHLSHYTVSENINFTISYISEQTKAKLTKQIHIDHFGMIQYPQNVVFVRTNEFRRNKHCFDLHIRGVIKKVRALALYLSNSKKISK